jgi:hypothetical protein
MRLDKANLNSNCCCDRSPQTVDPERLWGCIGSKSQSGLTKRNGDRIPFRKRSKSSAIPGVSGFRHDFPAVVQHACNMFVHSLHARQKPLPVILARPVPLIGIRLHFHLGTLAPPPL